MTSAVGILRATWDATVATKPPDDQIEFDYIVPHTQLFYGVTLAPINTDVEPKGMNRQLQGMFSGDWFTAHIMGETPEEVDDEIKALIKIAQDWNGDTDPDYNRVWPQEREIDRNLPDQQPGWRHATMPIQFLRNQRQLWTT